MALVLSTFGSLAYVIQFDNFGNTTDYALTFSRSGGSSVFSKLLPDPMNGGKIVSTAQIPLLLSGETVTPGDVIVYALTGSQPIAVVRFEDVTSGSHSYLDLIVYSTVGTGKANGWPSSYQANTLTVRANSRNIVSWNPTFGQPGYDNRRGDGTYEYDLPDSGPGLVGIGLLAGLALAGMQRPKA